MSSFLPQFRYPNELQRTICLGRGPLRTWTMWLFQIYFQLLNTPKLSFNVKMSVGKCGLSNCLLDRIEKQNQFCISEEEVTGVKSTTLTDARLQEWRWISGTNSGYSSPPEALSSILHFEPQKRLLPVVWFERFFTY